MISFILSIYDSTLSRCIMIAAINDTNFSFFISLHTLCKTWVLPRSASIIQWFVNICLLNVKGRGSGIDVLVKWKSKSTGTAVLAGLRSLRKYGILDRESRSVDQLRPCAHRLLCKPRCKCLSHLPSFPCSTDLSLVKE